MGRTQRCFAGKLLSLLTLPAEQWEAIEADLLDKGFVLADVPGRVTWRAVLAMVKHSPRTSAVVREAFGDEVSWSITDHLLAGILDYSALIAWLNSDTKKNERPEPVTRPGQKKSEQSMGTAVPVSEFQRLWDENIARAQQVELEAVKSPADAETSPGDGQPG